MVRSSHPLTLTRAFPSFAGIATATLIACSAGPTDSRPPPVDADVADVEGLMLIDATTLPTWWTAAPGFVLSKAEVVGDVTGDGIGDAVVQVTELALVDGSGSHTVIVAGPLRRSLTLPGDELAMVPSSYVYTYGDLTGDGVISLVLFSSLPGGAGNWVIEAPFAGTIDLLVTGRAGAGGYQELNGDGVLDLLTANEPMSDTLQFTWGPESRFGGPPDVSLSDPCGVELDEGLWTDWRTFPDLDGDGVRELLLERSPFTECGELLLPLPESTPTGYDPTTDPNAVTGKWFVEVVPDQTGDGAPDLWSIYDDQIFAAPITFAADGVSSALALPANTDLYQIIPTEIDFDGDGLGDWLAMDAEVDQSEVLHGVPGGGPPDPVTGEVLVVVSGGAGLASPKYGTAWDIEGSWFTQAFLEDGLGAVLILGHPDGIPVVDLGPATATAVAR